MLSSSFEGSLEEPEQGRSKRRNHAKRNIYGKSHFQTRSRSGFLVLSLEKNIVQDITQSQNALELEVFIHDNETVHP